MEKPKILLLGGYGNFGKRIAQHFAKSPNAQVIIAGRSLIKAKLVVEKMALYHAENISVVELDVNDTQFDQQLSVLAPFLVINCIGPFQGQSYGIPKACIDIGAHYIDLADDRRFVCDISSLNALAIEKNLLLVSGASSVPGLSSSVVNHYMNQFDSIDSVDIMIAPGNKAERGYATVKGIMSTIGNPLKVFRQSDWGEAYAWMDINKQNFGGKVGLRLLANVDVPDLEIFPNYFKVKQRVSFKAGLELPVLHYTLAFMAWLRKVKLIKHWSWFTKLSLRISHLFSNFGSDCGAMQVKLSGTGLRNEHKEISWTLIAEAGVGPYIPTLSAIILADKLIQKKLLLRGALPCVCLFTLDEFLPYAQQLNLKFSESVNG